MDSTFCPVVTFKSVRTIIALAAKYDLNLHQSNITTAFLNAELKEDIYMKQPEGFMRKGKEHHICKLKRSLYGLKQSPKSSNEKLYYQLKKMGLKQLKWWYVSIYTILRRRDVYSCCLCWWPCSCFSLLLIHTGGSVLPLQRNLVKERKGVWRRRIYRKYASCNRLQTQDQNVRADVVLSMSRGPPGQSFPETEYVSVHHLCGNKWHTAQIKL